VRALFFRVNIRVNSNTWGVVEVCGGRTGQWGPILCLGVGRVFVGHFFFLGSMGVQFY
jgi:uncharacterized protein YqgC (DUF456 family)